MIFFKSLLPGSKVGDTVRFAKPERFIFRPVDDLTPPIHGI